MGGFGLLRGGRGRWIVPVLARNHCRELHHSILPQTAGTNFVFSLYTILQRLLCLVPIPWFVLLFSSHLRFMYINTK